MDRDPIALEGAARMISDIHRVRRELAMVEANCQFFKRSGIAAADETEQWDNLRSAITALFWPWQAVTFGEEVEL